MAPTRTLTEDDFAAGAAYAHSAGFRLRRSNCPGEPGHEGFTQKALMRADFCDKCIEVALREAWLAGRMES